jgi:hypothetical protein
VKSAGRVCTCLFTTTPTGAVHQHNVIGKQYKSPHHSTITYNSSHHLDRHALNSLPVPRTQRAT